MAASVPKEVKVELDEAARLMVLKKYESAADVFASALESLEDAPVLAPILHQYGRALLEHVIEVAGALGPRDPVPEASNDTDAAGPDDARFSFGDEEAEQETPSAKASGKRKAAAEDAEPDEPEDSEDEQEEEDDLAVAFSVLDLARVILERILATSTTQAASSKSAGKQSAADIKLELLTGEVMDERALLAELGEVYNDLGDVGLESENFEQASSDYAASLRVLAPLLAPYSRRLSDAHLRLGLALEFHPDDSRRSEASTHIEQAMHVLQRRLAALEGADTAPADMGAHEKDNLRALDADQRERETRDVKEVLKDLEVKLDEMKAGPPAPLKDDGKPSNPALEEAIRDAFLNVTESLLGDTGTPAPSDAPVTDLSARVKRRKKSPP